MPVWRRACMGRGGSATIELPPELERLVPVVVHVRDPGGFDVYIGRACSRAADPRCHKTSVFANPYMLGGTGKGRHERAVQKYREWMTEMVLSQRHRNYWIEQLRFLPGKKIACWCKGWYEGMIDKPCHGDPIVEIIRRLLSEGVLP